MSPPLLRIAPLLALLLSLVAPSLRAQSDPVSAPARTDSTAGSTTSTTSTADATAEPARPDSAVRVLPEAMLGRWQCVRATTDVEPPLVLEVRADGRWADRSTSRAVVARWEWDGAVLRLLRAGGDDRHRLRPAADGLRSEEGHRCRKG